MATIDTFEKEHKLTVPAGAFLAREIPEPVALLPGLLNEDTKLLLSGDTGAGKSWFCVHIAYCIAGGKWCLPWGVPEPVPVLYIDGEMGEKLFQTRLQQIRKRDNCPRTVKKAEENLHILGKAWSKDMADVDEIHIRNYLTGVIATKGIKLVIIDNLDTLCPETLAKSAAWKSLVGWVQKLSSKKVAVMLVHHNNKKGVQHGSSEKTRQMDVVLTLKKSKEHKVKGEAVFLLTSDKNRDGGIELEPETRFVVRTTKDDFDEELVTKVMQEHLYSHQEKMDEEVKKHFLAKKTGKEIALLLGISAATVSRIRVRLVEEGLLE